MAEALRCPCPAPRCLPSSSASTGSGRWWASRFAGRLHGWLLFLDKRRMTSDDMVLGDVVAQQVLLTSEMSAEF
jgi:hypothetical protein